MVINRVRERHQNARYAGRSQFGNGQRTGPADHQIGPFVGTGHVVDESDTVRLHTGGLVVVPQLHRDVLRRPDAPPVDALRQATAPALAAPFH